MADSNEVKQVEASVANLVLDEVTGQEISKSELKRRQKTRAKEAEKKEKAEKTATAAAAAPKTQKSASAEDEEANLTPNVSRIANVLKVVPTWREVGSVEC